MPRVARPGSAAHRLIRPDLPHKGIQLGEVRVRHAAEPDFADLAQGCHARPVLKGPRTAALHGLDHFLRIPLLTQTPRAGFARVPLGDLHLRFRQVRARRVP